MMEKHIKTLAICISLLILVFGFTGCRINLDAIGEGPKMDNTIDTLLKAIQENDSDTIIQLFSEGVREEVGVEKLKEGVEYLHTFLKGDIVSREDSPISAGETISSGKKQRILYPNYKIITASDIYSIRFTYYTIDNTTPDYKGLFSLWVFNEPVRENIYMKEDFKGIYMPRKIKESERDIPHEYKTEYGAFTVPAGYYKDETISTDEKYYFTLDDIVLSGVIYNHFSIAIMDSEYGINELAAFREYALEDISDKKSKRREVVDYRTYAADAYIEEDQAEATVQGYPILRFSILEGSKTADKFFYIIGDNKYVLVQYTRTSRGSTPEGIKDEESMMDAVEALVDSFVWAE